MWGTLLFKNGVQPKFRTSFLCCTFPAVQIQQISRPKLTWIINIQSVPRSKHTPSLL
jgi:hypothetical protein